MVVLARTRWRFGAPMHRRPRLLTLRPWAKSICPQDDAAGGDLDSEAFTASMTAAAEAKRAAMRSAAAAARARTARAAAEAAPQPRAAQGARASAYQRALRRATEAFGNTSFGDSVKLHVAR